MRNFPTALLAATLSLAALSPSAAWGQTAQENQEPKEPSVQGSSNGKVDEAARAEVLNATREFTETFRSADVEKMDPVLAEGFFFVEPNGRVRDKGAVLRALKERGAIGAVSTEDVRVQVYGNAAVLTAIHAVKEREETLQVRSIQMWVKRPERWQLSALHTTRIDKRR